VIRAILLTPFFVRDAYSVSKFARAIRLSPIRAFVV
jgi:hypothetical protein